MLSKYLYNLSAILSTDFFTLDSLKTSFLDENIVNEIYYKKLFSYKWREKLLSPIKNINFSYNYRILEENSQFIKLSFILRRSFPQKYFSKSISSVAIEKYIIIIEKSTTVFKFILLVNDEEDLILYDNLKKDSLSTIQASLNKKDSFLWQNKLSMLDYLYDLFIKLSFINKKARMNGNKFDINKATKYAEKYALIPNTDYKSFHGIGGDCTNFVSQIIHEGGLSKTKTWKPYSNSWIRVEELYSYLINNKLGYDVSKVSPFKKGNIIQFYRPEIGKFFHTGFITYELSNGDCLYCCHSYNKLNYPLSEIYPIIYPTLRAIKPN
ncbi:MAG: hypothetical protein E7208_03535 [Clostridium butyricum]|nr:hypothetical protein [Clostridium butyricum]